MRAKKIAALVAAGLLLGGVVESIGVASPTPTDPHKGKPAVKPPSPSQVLRDPVATARQNPAIAEQLKKTGEEGSVETVIQVPLGGQCGIAGCSSTTLVAFSYRSRGANPATRSVLALVACQPMPTIPCTAVLAEVRATQPANPAQ
jgi:hypothetical protein